MKEKWEYDITGISKNESLEARLILLNSKGSQGWEVCGTVKTKKYYEYTLKRRTK